MAICRVPSGHEGRRRQAARGGPSSGRRASQPSATGSKRNSAMRVSQLNAALKSPQWGWLGLAGLHAVVALPRTATFRIRHGVLPHTAATTNRKRLSGTLSGRLEPGRRSPAPCREFLPPRSATWSSWARQWGWMPKISVASRSWLAVIPEPGVCHAVPDTPPILLFPTSHSRIAEGYRPWTPAGIAGPFAEGTIGSVVLVH
jgi:hypothetical protein